MRGSQHAALAHQHHRGGKVDIQCAVAVEKRHARANCGVRGGHGLAGVERFGRRQLDAQRFDFGQKFRVAVVDGLRAALHFRRKLRRVGTIGQIARGVDHVAAQIQCLRGDDQLQRQHLAQIVDHRQHVTGFIRTHRNVVLGIGAGRN